jgi:addiction module HigA family antidote
MAKTTERKSIPRPAEPIPEPTSPGELLLEEWLSPMNLSQSALAEKMGVHVQVVNGIVNRRRAVTAHTALLLASALGTTPEFWMNAQVACDLWNERVRIARKAKK